VHAHELKPSEPAFRELSSLQSLDHAAAEAEAIASKEDKERARRKEKERERERERQVGVITLL
jgi:hypothetical protein